MNRYDLADGWAVGIQESGMREPGRAVLYDPAGGEHGPGSIIMRADVPVQVRAWSGAEWFGARTLCSHLVTMMQSTIQRDAVTAAARFIAWPV
mgnify:FL=1